MLACAKIGAVHSVVYAGFSSNALAGRMEDQEAKMLITSDIGHRRGKEISMKEGVCDEAVKNIKFLVADGSKGYLKEKPYDRIIVTASLPSIENHPLLSQLKKNGILIAPVGDKYLQELIIYKKEFNSYTRVLPVMFVPLVGKFGFKE